MVNNFRSSKYVQLLLKSENELQETVDLTSHNTACPIQANLKLQHLKNNLDTLASQILDSSSSIS